MIQAILSVLRRPGVIVGEIAAIAITAMLGASFPQAGSASETQLAALRTHGRFGTGIVELFSLDHVFQSVWFSAITALAAISLMLTVLDQVRRLRRAWSIQLTERDFCNAPFRMEFERPSRTVNRGVNPEARIVTLRTERRFGLAGAPIFHIGLLMIVMAGTTHALFGVHATVDLIEGEILPPTAEAWSAQWPGVLAKPFRLHRPITLNQVTARHYEEGDLQFLQARFSFEREGIARSEELAVNHDLFLPGGRLYVGSDFGPAPMIEWHRNGYPPVREVPMLVSKDKFLHEGALSLSDGMKVYLRARIPQTGKRPDQLEIRVMKGPALLFAGTVSVGTLANLGNGLKMQLHGMPYWVRLHGSRDPALWAAYLGFAITLLGATLLFMVIKIDTCVAIRPEGDAERVLVALKAQRFDFIFEERFNRLVRTQGGSL